jgi:hypothetical protein
MTSFADFEESLSAETPPAGLSAVLTALWWVRKGDWDLAHKLVQNLNSSDDAWVHAHLHRVEGDLANAEYWYRRAGKDMASNSLGDEWKVLAQAFSK